MVTARADIYLNEFNTTMECEIEETIIYWSFIIFYEKQSLKDYARCYKMEKEIYH